VTFDQCFAIVQNVAKYGYRNLTETRVLYQMMLFSMTLSDL